MKKMKFSLQPELGTLSERDSKRYFSTLGLSAVALIVSANLASILIQILLLTFAPWLLDYALVMQIVSVIPLYLIGFPCAYLVLRRLPKGVPSADTMGAKNVTVGLMVSLALMMVGNYIGNAFIIFMESLMGRTLLNPVETATVGQAWWMNLIFVGILAPIVEEIFFRKVVCDRLLVLGEGYTIVLSAALFGLAHGNLFQFFYAFLLGAFFALIYVKTGCLRYSIAYHIVVNVLGGVLSAWLLEKLEPLLTEEALEELFRLSKSSDPTALINFVRPFIVPLSLLAFYNIFILVSTVVGLVVIFRSIKHRRIRLQEGLLPPMREGRVGNIFFNGGVAAALTVFVIVFLLSFLPS